MFSLTYGSGGAFNYSDVMDMDRNDRDAFLDLLIEQKKAEEHEIKTARRKAKRRG